MSEIVFIHCQSFARKPNAAGQSVAQVIAEGLRSGEYHPHVDGPKPPVPIFGNPIEFQKMHDDHVAKCWTRAVKNGQVGERAIRQDRHTLFTVVASYPVSTDIVQDSPEELGRFKRWVNLTLAWIRAQYGDQLKAAFAHVDEQYPHLHFWLLPDDRSADASLLHPGKIAKRETETRMKAIGTFPREAVKLGNRALKDTMRAWIDDYHREVGAPLGMNRDGPKRRRLSRAQHSAEQLMLDHHRRLESDRAKLAAEVVSLEEKVIAMETHQRELETNAAAFLDRAEQHQQRMHDEVAQVAALGPMFDALVKEIEDGTIEFDTDVGCRVKNPAPFRAVGKFWGKLEPTVKRLVKMVQAAEDGTWTDGAYEPRSPALQPAKLDPVDISM